ncbi:MAG TPA: hypothetical protein PKV97_00295 [Thauera aminoaromatica]|nr:hypothetical protein [Thauera aminoaromatica]
MIIDPIFGGPFPTDDPQTMGAPMARLIPAGYVEVGVDLTTKINGEVNLYLLMWDDDAGWLPLERLVANQRGVAPGPPLTGKNHFQGIQLPTQRYLCLYCPDLTSDQITMAVINGYSGGIPLFNTFWTPWTATDPGPSEQANPENQEFAGSELNSGWDFTETWVEGGVNRFGNAYSAPPNQVFYSVGERPSWILMQGAAGIGPGFATISRQYASSSPLNWYMSALCSFDVNNFPLGTGDVAIYFMSQSSAGAFDPNNWVGIYCGTDGSGKWGFSMAATIGGVFGGVFAGVPGSLYVCPGVAPDISKLVIHKVGNAYKAMVGTLGGSFLLLGTETYLGFNPDRFGFAVANTNTPNLIVGVDWVRHEEKQVVNE